MKSRKLTAIVPARGGSKRIPRKNILDIDGIPMLVRTLNNILDSDIFDRVIVSTEDDEIADTARKNGAEVVLRDISLTKDDVSVDQVCADLLLQHRWINYFACIYPTSILLSPRSIISSSTIFFNDTEHGLVGVSKSNFHPAEALIISEGQITGYFSPELHEKRSQEYPEVAFSNGTIYWSSRKLLNTFNTLVPITSKLFWVNPDEVLDVNYPEDITLLHSRLKKDDAKVVSK